MHFSLIPSVTALAAISFLMEASSIPSFAADEKPAEKPLGYQDTPLIPGTQWHVHDGLRPQPKVVTPGTNSTPEQAGTAPSDAIMLFDGKDLSAWKGTKGEAEWKVENGYFEVVKGAGAITTKGEFGPDLQLHIEWMAPNPPKGSGQGRGNSGLFFFGKYETQILDNFENPTYPDGSAGGIYGFLPPLVNACRKPGEWQSYDVIFVSPRFEGDKLKSPAYITNIHNGVVVQAHSPILGATGHKSVAKYKPHGPKGVITLQDHGDPVRFRNIWIRELQLPTDSDGVNRDFSE